MSVCINPNCPNPINQETQLFCQACHSELLLDARYRVIRQLGGGGFGKTYEVKDCALRNLSETQSGLKVLKVLSNNHPKYVELFQREAQFLARLNHPGIPKVESDAYFTFFPRTWTEPLHCLVMEKIEGMDLKQYLTRRNAGINQQRAIQWLIQLAHILEEIHSRNFFHRDIKPSNIMLQPDGQLVLIDFGTAREVTDTYMSKEAAGQVTGLFSAGYSPLEQLNGQAIPQSDFFALGRTFVFLLTAKNPSEMYDHQANQLYWREYVPNLSLEFADFLDSLMAQSPSQRPQSARVIIERLTAIYGHLYPTENHSQPKKPVYPTSNPMPLPTLEVTVPDSSLTKATSRSPAEMPVTAMSSDTQSLLDSRFIAHCQQELTQLIGPMAAIICQRAISRNSNISTTEFVKTLAKTIPSSQEAEDFEKRMLS